jgi:multiple RNA-binding domain-containing protein 1
MCLLSERKQSLLSDYNAPLYGHADNCQIHVPTNKADGKGKGFAFVQFEDHEHAVAAFDDTDGTIFQGRLIHIISGKAKRDNTLDEFAISKLPLKKQKEVLRKKNAASGAFNWNSLYLNVRVVLVDF